VNADKARREMAGNLSVRKHVHEDFKALSKAAIPNTAVFTVDFEGARKRRSS